MFTEQEKLFLLELLGKLTISAVDPNAVEVALIVRNIKEKLEKKDADQP